MLCQFVEFVLVIEGYQYIMRVNILKNILS